MLSAVNLLTVWKKKTKKRWLHSDKFVQYSERRFLFFFNSAAVTLPVTPQEIHVHTIQRCMMEKFVQERMKVWQIGRWIFDLMVHVCIWRALSLSSASTCLHFLWQTVDLQVLQCTHHLIRLDLSLSCVSQWEGARRVFMFVFKYF